MQHTNRKLTGEEIGSINAAHANASRVIAKTISETLEGVERQVAARSYRAANALRNAALVVLRGGRAGRVYKIPGTHGEKASKATKKLSKDYGHKLRGGQLYRASAPGEAPASRTGIFRLSWGPHVRVEKNGQTFRAVSSIGSGVRVGKHVLGDLLEDGTDRMDPRPYKQAVRDMALPKIKEIFDKPYIQKK